MFSEWYTYTNLSVNNKLHSIIHDSITFWRFILKVAGGSCTRQPDSRSWSSCGVLVQPSPLTKMTARKSGSRLETEIERCRSESLWDKIPELVRQLSAKLISNGKKRAGFPVVWVHSGTAAFTRGSVLGVSWQPRPRLGVWQRLGSELVMLAKVKASF